MARTIKVDTIDTPSGSGNITFNRPIAGDGSNLTSLPAHTGNVAFPATQVASADANTLDDYEEGVWTPTISTTVSGFSTGITAWWGNQPTYVKIGRTVLLNGGFYLGNSSGNIAVGDSFTIDSGSLPFVNIGARSSVFMRYFYNTGNTGYSSGDLVASLKGEIFLVRGTSGRSGGAFAFSAIYHV